MASLAELKEAIFAGADYRAPLEKCYAELLDSYNHEHAVVFMGLLEMLDRDSRVNEILRVADLIRMPVKKCVEMS
ncbi:hypothetical protein PAPHI01_1749 [Pancytospora philotis]|nr:hypothetical protein PAPHI01_1749 [Pancytospora philotis]